MKKPYSIDRAVVRGKRIDTSFAQRPTAYTPAPAAACQRCGGWTNYGGMSQHYNATEPVDGRTGCTCTKGN